MPLQIGSRPALIALSAFALLAGLLAGAATPAQAGQDQTYFQFRWVYQPDGSTDLPDSLGQQRAQVRETERIDLATGVVNASPYDFYYCDGNCGGSTGPGLWANNGAGGIHDLGAIDFASVTTVSDASVGVGAGQYYENQEVPIIAGHVYAVVTGDAAHYARLIIDAIEPAPDLIQGDVDCSGEVTTLDALAILSFLADAELPPVTGGCIQIAGNHYTGFYQWGDLNCVDGVTAFDIVPALRYLASVPPASGDVCTPIGQPFDA